MNSEPSPRLWLWSTILSLDAPLIAVSWQLLLARALHLSVNRLEPLVLALSVWFVYLADHLFDALHPPAAAWKPARKTFYRHHLSRRFASCRRPLRIPALGGLLVSELWQRRETGRASI
jgi:hypothetical protein